MYLAIATCAPPSPAAAGDLPDGADRVTVCPTDDGRALVNPGMGWVLYF